MIIKNEEEYLPNCLESIKNLVDEIIIVDTGSNDNSINIAKKYTKKVFEITFKNDFSEARNFALEQAEGDWILVIDADEQFTPDEFEKLRTLLTNVSNENLVGFKLFRYNYFKNGGWYTGDVLRVFKNSSKIRYSGKVNESVEPSIKSLNGYIEKTKIIFHHFGHSKSFQSRTVKNNHYINIFKERIKETPDNAVLYGFVALLERAQGNFDVAIEYGKKALEINPNLSIVNVFVGHVYKSMGDFETALKLYEQAVRIDPYDASIHNNIGLVKFCQLNYDSALESFKKGLEVDNSASYIYINIGLVYEWKQNFKEAVRYYNIALEKNPMFTYEHPRAKLEPDPYYIFYLETIPHYCGLNYHLARCNVLCN